MVKPNFWILKQEVQDIGFWNSIHTFSDNPDLWHIAINDARITKTPGIYRVYTRYNFQYIFQNNS